jgi:nuclear pore complex protein Nup155
LTGSTELPYEAVVTAIRALAHRLNLSESTFPPTILIPMLEKYAYEFQRDVGPRTWVADLFIDVGVPYETIVQVLEGMIYNDEMPFQGRNRSVIAREMLHVIRRWVGDCVRNNERLFGGEEVATSVASVLDMLTRNGLVGEEVNEAVELRRRIEKGYR